MTIDRGDLFRGVLNPIKKALQPTGQLIANGDKPVWRSDSTPLPKNLLSRREFLISAGAVSSVLALHQLLTPTAQAAEGQESRQLDPAVRRQADLVVQKKFGFKFTDLIQPAVLMALQSDKGKGTLAKFGIKPGSYQETMVQTGLLFLSETIGTEFLARNGVKIGGNTGFSQEQFNDILEHLDENFVNMVLTVPVLEEMLFRFLPAFVSTKITNNPKGYQGASWKVGIPSALVFAMIHNPQKSVLEQLTNLEYFPARIFIDAMVYWKFMRDKGLSHDILAHGEVNTIALTIAKAMYESNK